MAHGNGGGESVVDEAGTWRLDAAAIVGLLVALNLSIAAVLDGGAAATAQILAAAAAVAGARRRGYSWPELGFGRHDVPSGLKLGGLVAVVVVAFVAAAAIVPSTSTYFDDDRFADLSAVETLWEVGFRIPFVTALTEEVLFRSVLLAVFIRAWGAWRAALVSSMCFGLWHVSTTLSDLGGNEVTDDFAGWEVAGGVTGVVAVTAAAGAALAWLRLRSRSIVAPWLAHTAINASTFLAGVLLAG